MVKTFKVVSPGMFEYKSRRCSQAPFWGQGRLDLGLGQTGKMLVWVSKQRPPTNGGIPGWLCGGCNCISPLTGQARQRKKLLILLSCNSESLYPLFTVLQDRERHDSYLPSAATVGIVRVSGARTGQAGSTYGTIKSCHLRVQKAF